MNMNDLKPGDERLVVTEVGAARIERLTSTYLRHTMCGVGTKKFYFPIVDSCNQVLHERGELVVMIDGWDQKHIEYDFRDALGAYMNGLKGRNCKALMLVRDQLSKMSMDIANMAAGNRFIETFDSIESWETACAQVIKMRFSRRPITERELKDARREAKIL